MNETVEIYVTAGCPFCASARDDLEWRGIAFMEYDVDADPDAREKMLLLTGGKRTVPVIVAPNEPIKIGWMGAGCNI